MRKSTVKIVVRGMVDRWLASVTDEELKRDLKRDLIVSGGAISSLLGGEKVNDYDIYFRTMGVARRVAEYYVNIFNVGDEATDGRPEVMYCQRINLRGEEEPRIIIKTPSRGVSRLKPVHEQDYEHALGPVESVDSFLQLDKKNKFKPVFLSENAVTLTNRVQLVIRFFGEPKEIHDNYDFAHCMCHYDYYYDTLEVHPQAFESILSKSLIYQGSLYPIASLFRIRKFIRRGWSITAGQMLKIIYQLSKVDLSDMATLREQLTGVDQSYMSALIQALENREKGQVIDSLYLAKLIDKIFEE